MAVLVPYHLDERLPGLADGLPSGWAETVVDVIVAPGADGPPGWPRLIPLYRAVAAAIAGQVREGGPPVEVVSSCCGVGLGVLAGLQHAGVDASVVWFDAHGDVQTMETTTSGYLGGMPVRVIAGYRPELVADALGLRALPEDRITLVDARDLDPPEAAYLATAAIRRCTVEELDTDALPPGPLLVHIDLDVVAPADLPGLRFPVPGGPAASAVVAAVQRIAATGRLAALHLACSWDPSTPDPSDARRRLTTELLATVAPRG